MRRTIVAIIPVGSAFWASIIYQYFVPDTFFSFSMVMFVLPLAGISLMAILVATAFDGISKHKFFSPAWLLPCLLCGMFLSGLVLWWPLKLYLDDWQFDRQLGEYTRVVNDVKSGAIKTRRYTTVIDSQIKKFPGRAKRIWAAACNHGTAVVEFHIPSGGGALGPHWGYLYDDCDDPAVRGIHGNSYDNGRFDLHHIQGAWYEFAH